MESISSWLHRPGSYYHLVRPGSKIGPLETLALLILPCVLLCDSLRTLTLTNLALQSMLFLCVVQLPAFITSRMSYVDIGWPCGLLVLAAVTVYSGNGFLSRKLLAGACLSMHGGRMAFGALVLFFPYSFPEDLPRYRYAKQRFEYQDGMPSSLWPIKIQHDTLQQCFANCTVLAVPFFLMANDSTAALRAWEICCAVCWALCSLLENMADSQKMLFLKQCPKEQRETAVLGRAPFDTWQYCLWARCRHPNYFFEWMCWNSFVLMSVPSLFAFGESILCKLALALMLLLTSRFFYDCLVYWTGAEPAEYYSARKRAEYRKHQETTRVFFPFEVPYFCHHRVAGWPTPTDFQ